MFTQTHQHHESAFKYGFRWCNSQYDVAVILLFRSFPLYLADINNYPTYTLHSFIIRHGGFQGFQRFHPIVEHRESPTYYNVKA